MKDKDEHFWIDDVINRLPSGLIPESKDWSSVLSALTKLKTERNNAIAERNELAAQVERLKGMLKRTKADICEWMDAYGDDCRSTELICLTEKAIEETPAQSLEAVKRDWLTESFGKIEANMVDIAKEAAEGGDLALQSSALFTAEVMRRHIGRLKP